MASRITNFAEGSIVPSATLNLMQDRAVALRTATESATDSGAPTFTGADEVFFQTPSAGVSDAHLALVDDASDWRGRRIGAVVTRLPNQSYRTGQSGAYAQNDPTQGIRSILVLDRPTGTGATGAASATVADGTPPVIASGSSPVIAWEGSTDADRLWLYARPDDGALCLYNDLGATFHGELRVWGLGVAPEAGAEPPSVIPTETEIAWIEPSAAADRPADPGDGRYIHRATDTGAITLWDGAAWRAFGTTGGATNPLTADLDADGYQVTGLGAPSASSDAATKGYVDTLVPAQSSATTTTTTPLTVYSVTLSAGDVRVIEITMRARNSAGTKGGAWKRTLAVRADFSGTITALDSVDTIATVFGSGWTGAAAACLVCDIAAGQVDVNVVGVSGTLTWAWSITVTG